jgi:hypothetical protein
MTLISTKPRLLGAVCLWVAAASFSPDPAVAQYPPFAIPTTPDAQRNALQTVQAQIVWLQSTTRTSPNNPGGYDLLWQRFQEVRAAFNAFKNTLTPAQTQYGANDLAELDAALDIIQSAFTGYQTDLSNGRSGALALRSLCQVLNQTAALWLQELNKDCARLRVGRP